MYNRIIISISFTLSHSQKKYIFKSKQCKRIGEYICVKNTVQTVGPRNLDPIYIVTYYMKWAKTSWTDSKCQNYKTILKAKRKGNQVFLKKVISQTTVDLKEMP